MAAVATVAAVLSMVAASGAEARVRRSHETDSVGTVRRISISNRGIEIEHAGDARDSGVHRSIRVDGASGTVEISGDTLDFGPGTRAHVPGLVVSVDESGIVRMFSDAEVHKGERVEGDVVAIFGDAVIDGQVTGNAVAVFGSVRLSPSAAVDGDAVAIGGGLDQPPGATVRGESVSLGFMPIHWGVPTLKILLGVVLLGWALSLFLGWMLMLLVPSRMLRIATTASQRTGSSLALGMISGPLLVIAIVLLLVTVIGIPIAFILPLLYFVGVWAGQLAVTYGLGCRLTHRRLGEGGLTMPMVAGTFFVALFFVVGTLLANVSGVMRTVALFFDLLGLLFIIGLSVIGAGALLLSRLGGRPREVEHQREASPFGAGSMPIPPSSASTSSAPPA